MRPTSMCFPFVLPLVENVEDSKVAPLNHVRARSDPTQQLHTSVNVANLPQDGMLLADIEVYI